MVISVGIIDVIVRYKCCCGLLQCGLGILGGVIGRNVSFSSEIGIHFRRIEFRHFE